MELSDENRRLRIVNDDAAAEQAKKLREAADELREFADKLDVVKKANREEALPTAAVEFTEAQLTDLIDLLNEVDFRKFGPTTDRAYNKLLTALRVETDSGGKFYTP